MTKSLSTFRFPIRFKLLISFLLILLVATAIVVFAFNLTEQFVRSQRIGILNDKAQSVSDSLQDFVLDIELQHLNLANEYRKDTINKTQNFPGQALNLVRTNTAITRLSLLSPVGRELSEYDDQGRVADAKLSLEIPTDAFKVALGNDTGISKAYFPEDRQHPVIDIYSPVANEHNQVIAVIKSQIALQNLQLIFSRLNLGRSGVAYIVDTEGQIISHPDDDHLTEDLVVNRLVVSKLMHQSYKDIVAADHYYTNEHNIKVVASSNNVTALNWIAVVEQPEQEVFSQLFLIRYLLIGAVAAGLILLVTLAVLISNSLARPIRQLQQGTRRIAEGDLASRVEIGSRDELEELAGSFNSMASQLSQREQSLQQSNINLAFERDRQAALLQSLTDGVYAVDRNNKIVLFNKAAELITGLTSQSVLNQPVDLVLPLHRGDTPLSITQYAFQEEDNKQRLRTEGLELRQGEQRLILSLAIAPVKDDDGQITGWIASFHDVTKEREFEAMKLDFVSMAAHELRTPLTALRGYLSILKEEAKSNLEEKQQLFLDRALISSNQLLSLVENLLNVSKIERGALKVDLVPMQPEDMIAGAMANLLEVAKHKQIELTFDQPKQPLPLVMADQFRISEVLTNLTANGINYTKPNGWVKIGVTADDKYVTISVSDNGEGIPAASIQHLFTKFYRVNSSLAMGSKGTGLGLYISKSIVDAHHGRIWVESKEGQGSTFFFSIPLAPAGSSVPVLGKPTPATIIKPA